VEKAGAFGHGLGLEREVDLRKQVSSDSAALLDSLTGSRVLDISFEANAAYVEPNNTQVGIDRNYSDLYITPDGTVRESFFAEVLFHEVLHAVLDTEDVNQNLRGAVPDGDYTGGRFPVAVWWVEYDTQMTLETENLASSPAPPDGRKTVILAGHPRSVKPRGAASSGCLPQAESWFGDIGIAGTRQSRSRRSVGTFHKNGTGAPARREGAFDGKVCQIAL